MLEVNKNVFMMLNILMIFLLSGCFSEKELEQPVREYFFKEYGIKDGIKILSTDNNWFEGIGHKTYVEMEKPYHTMIYLMIDRNFLDINKNDSDDVLLEIFKGAYVEQHKNVLKQSEKIIKKYNLMEESPYEEDVGKQNFYYYLNFNLKEEQEKDLREQFKMTQTLNTEEILPSLNISEPKRNIKYLGVVNFIYYYKTYNDYEEVPKAQSIVDDFKESHVLTEGIYNIAINTMKRDKYSFSQGFDVRNTNILFQVDESGKFKVMKPLKK